MEKMLITAALPIFILNEHMTVRFFLFLFRSASLRPASPPSAAHFGRLDNNGAWKGQSVVPPLRRFIRLAVRRASSIGSKLRFAPAVAADVGQKPFLPSLAMVSLFKMEGDIGSCRIIHIKI